MCHAKEENQDKLMLMAEDVELKLQELDKLRAEWNELKEKLKEEGNDTTTR